jgi:hypothetical protein
MSVKDWEILFRWDEEDALAGIHFASPRKTDDLSETGEDDFGEEVENETNADEPVAKRQKGSAFKVEDTADGGLVLINDDGIVKTTHIFPTTVDILKRENLKSYEHRKKWKLTTGGYVAWNFQPIHRILGDTLSDDEARERWTVRFAENPHDTLVVGHLDNNPLNFNIENLEKIPQSVNLLSKKSKPLKRPGKFWGVLGYNNKRVTTKSVDTEAEALFAIDVTKIKIVPPDVRQYLLEHAMWRPLGYEKRYSSVEKMLSYAKMYEPRERKKPAKRESKNTYFAYRDLDAAMEALPAAHAATIKQLFAMTGIVPFDAAIDAIVFYVGYFGLQLVFVINYDFYAKHMMLSKPRMKITKSGYLEIDFAGKLSFLHLKVMGRDVGQSQKDGLCGGHGAGKVLDNRARVLKPLTPGENCSDKGNVLLQSAPGVPGVSWHKALGKWEARIGSLLKRADCIFLGYDDNQAVAASWYAFANANKKEFKTICATLPDVKTRNNYVRACCGAQALLPVPLAAGAQN